MFLDTVDQFATIAAGKTPLIINVAAAKMNAPAVELVARAMLCNWLVCLAIWTSARMTNDTAKCIAIFWCLYAFIASGFEHSVANMTLLSIVLTKVRFCIWSGRRRPSSKRTVSRTCR